MRRLAGGAVPIALVAVAVWWASRDEASTGGTPSRAAATDVAPLATPPATRRRVHPPEPRTSDAPPAWSELSPAHRAVSRSIRTVTYHEQPIADILRDVAARSGVRIDAQDDARTALAGTRASLLMDRDVTAAEALDLLTAFRDLAWEIDGHRVVIRRKSAPVTTSETSTYVVSAAPE